MVLPVTSASSRQVLVWSLPTVAFVLSILWYRRRSRGSKPQTDPGGEPDTSAQPAQATTHESAAAQGAVVVVTSEERQEELLSACHLDSNLCEVILTQSEIRSAEVSCCLDTAASLLEDSALLITAGYIKSESVSLDTIQEEKEEKPISSFLQENKVEKPEQEPPVTLLPPLEVVEEVLEVQKVPEVEHSAALHTTHPPQTMTEVEEQSTAVQASEAVGAGGDVATTTAAPPVLSKISVDVEHKQEEEEEAKSAPHQPRDSANHSPAEAMLASPSISNDSDTHSVGSNDSGKGGSDVTAPVVEEDTVTVPGEGVKRGSGSRRTSTSSCASSSGAQTEQLAALAVRPHVGPSSSTSAAPSLVNSEKGATGTVVACNTTPCMFEFVIPQQLVGRLIGKHGCFVQQIKTDTNSSIFVKRHPESAKYKVCAVEGTQHEIEQALKLIRKKFPIKKYPGVTLERVMFLPPPMMGYPLIPESLQMYLVECVNNDVVLSSLVNAGHMFLQQPTHPTFPVLSQLIMSMTQCYSENESPTLPNPAPGIVCAAPSLGGWYRAEVIDVRTEEAGERPEGGGPEEEVTVCDIKFVDYGGFMTLPSSELRQIRTDFMMLPFQATECYMADITWPESDEGWSEEATQCVEELTRDQVLQAQVVGYAENSMPLIRLFSSIHGPMAVMVNEILVARGLAKYHDPVMA